MKIIITILLATLVACSANQVHLASPLSPSTSPMLYELAKSVTVKAPHAEALTLNAGTRWKEVGRIEYGTVYRTKDQVVIVNSFNVHEGYIVVKDLTIVGYYLPIEKAFVKSKEVSIELVNMEKINEN